MQYLRIIAKERWHPASRSPDKNTEVWGGLVTAWEHKPTWRQGQDWHCEWYLRAPAVAWAEHAWTQEPRDGPATPVPACCLHLTLALGLGQQLCLSSSMASVSSLSNTDRPGAGAARSPVPGPVWNRKVCELWMLEAWPCHDIVLHDLQVIHTDQPAPAAALSFLIPMTQHRLWQVKTEGKLKMQVKRLPFISPVHLTMTHWVGSVGLTGGQPQVEWA